jgi:thioredoxin 1
MDAFKKLVSDKEYVLVDYNAVWCKPCKQLAPIVEKISVDKADKLKLLKVIVPEQTSDINTFMCIN